jgi:hypothetical protein
MSEVQQLLGWLSGPPVAAAVAGCEAVRFPGLAMAPGMPFQSKGHAFMSRSMAKIAVGRSKASSRGLSLGAQALGAAVMY